MTAIVIHTTTDSHESAKILANEILDRQIAGCIQIMPVESFFKWNGGTENKTEYKLFIKSTENYFKEIEETIKQISSYEVPEIYFVKIDDINKGYFQWLYDSISSSKVW